MTPESLLIHAGSFPRNELSLKENCKGEKNDGEEELRRTMARLVLTWEAENPQLNVIGRFRSFLRENASTISQTTYDNLRRNYKFDENKNVVPKKPTEKDKKKTSKGGRKIDLVLVKRALQLRNSNLTHETISERLGIPKKRSESWATKYMLDPKGNLVPRIRS